MRLTVKLEDIQAAQKELKHYLQPSPLLFNPALSEIYGCQIFLKLENMQPIGSFKIRGATLKISRLSSARRKKGVIAASAGNHAQGVAWGSRRLKTKALIVMPEDASLVKVQNTRALGAKIHFEGKNYDEAFAAMKRIARQTGRVIVHAYEDADVIAGQGTVGLEILTQLPEVDFIFGSIGGGGLMAGVGIAVKELRPRVKIVGCQAAGAASMVRSIRKGRVVRLDSVSTFADGIAVKTASEVMRRILSRRLNDLCVADDEHISSAILMLMEKAKVVAEGSGALPLACLEKLKNRVRGKNVVLIISGGNIDVNLLSRIIDRGLVRAGRRLRANVTISDRPGSLSSLTKLIASGGASILQVIHDRNELSMMIDQTEVDLTLETKGPKHKQSLIKLLRNNVSRADFTGE